jgi:hypothetical protein
LEWWVVVGLGSCLLVRLVFLCCFRGRFSSYPGIGVENCGWVGAVGLIFGMRAGFGCL